MTVSHGQFLDRLADSRLLTREEVQELLNSLPPEKHPKNGDFLARLLVQHGKLTPYQAERVYVGRGRSLVMGNYVVLDKLGQGGMGVVYKAEHQRMERVVALKVLAERLTNTPEALARFQREVKMAAKLDHPNIVAAFDADEADGTHFLVMQFVDGHNLSSLVRAVGPLPVAQATSYIVQAARGLEFAHRLGVVHRDVKPSNLLVDQDGTVKVLDMGLARLESADEELEPLTGTDQIMGTVDYIAPEQAMDTKHADARADIYSLGMTLWYLLTGRAAYSGESVLAKLVAHRDSPIPSLLDANPNIPPSLQAIFERMVSKLPENRYQSIGEFLPALEECVGDEEIVPLLPQRPGDETRLDGLLAQYSAQSELGGELRGGLELSVDETYRASQTRQDRSLEIGSTILMPSSQDDTHPETEPALEPALVPTAQSVGQVRHGWGGIAAVLIVCVAAVVAGLLATTKDDDAGQNETEQDAAESDGASESTKSGEGLSSRDDSPPTGSGGGPDDVWDGNRRVGWTHCWEPATNLGLPVNDRNADGSPTLTADGKTLIFHRPNPDSVHAFYQLMVATLGDEPAVYGQPEWLGDQVNRATTTNARLTPDGLMLVFDSTRQGPGDIWMSYRRTTTEAWSPAVSAGDKVNSESRDENPCLSADGLTLFYSSNREGGYGKFDIWVAHRATVEKPFGNPVNAGPAINGPDDEKHPWISEDGRLLIVSAMRPEGFGGLDLYVCERSSTEAPFGPPRNLGPSVNTVAFEAHASIVRNGRLLVFESNRQVGSHGDYDIWVAKRQQKSHPGLAVAPFDSELANQHQAAWADYLELPVQKTVPLIDEELSLQLIPPGQFLMGASDGEALATESERPQHWVTISRPFYMATTEITVGQFRDFVRDATYTTEAQSDGKGAYSIREERDETLTWDVGEGNDDLPVTCVSWKDGLAFCTWLSARTGSVYRLPSDAEWEYACRAGTSTLYSFGSEFDFALANAHRSGSEIMPTHSYPPNPFGLYEMHGNVHEICIDSPRGYTQFPVMDPFGVEDTGTVVVRGGAISSGSSKLRSSHRYVDDARSLPGEDFATEVKGMRIIELIPFEME